MKLELQIEGVIYEVEIGSPDGARSAKVRKSRSRSQSSVLPTARSSSGDAEKRVCRSPVNGIVSRVHIQAGDEMRADDPMLVLEAMKMETRMLAPISGRLKRVHVAPGDAVKANQVLVEFE